MARRVSSSPFVWSSIKEQAAALMADGKLNSLQIAEQCGIASRTLIRWGKYPEFRARVDEHQKAQAQVVQETLAQVQEARVYKYDITSKESRLALYQDMLNRHIKLVEARARDIGNKGTGADTGLIVDNEKPARYGNLIEYRFDGPLMDSIRKYSELAAREKGQLTDKVEQNVTHAGESAKVVIEYRHMPPPTEEEADTEESQPE